jgi:hypothetical protein
MEKSVTIAEGLGLNEEWALINRHRVEKTLEANDTVSDTLLSCIESLRDEEFGGAQEISAYEKKIIMAGFHLAQVIIHKQHQSAGNALAEVLGTLRGLKENLEDE